MQELVSPKWLLSKRALQVCRSVRSARASVPRKLPRSRTLIKNTAPWYLTLQVFILLERHNLWKMHTANRIILACFALKANYWSTDSSLCKIFRPDKKKSEFLYNITFFRKCYRSRKSVLYGCTLEKMDLKYKMLTSIRVFYRYNVVVVLSFSHNLAF